MRFMIIRKADAETEAGAEPAPELLRAMLAYNQEMIDAGIFLEGSGLQRSSKGARIAFSSGNPTVTDGPFTEAKELIAGFSIIDVPTKQDAIDWVKRWPQIDGHGSVQIEIRQMFSASDFGEEAEAQLKEFESRIR